MKWTEEQSRAIYSDDKKLLVAAAAGSGKTAVLSERIANALRNGGEISRVLVVTFTNAAAEEMKGRIRKKIKEDQQRNPGSAVFWQRQIDHLEWASIQTFHSFCKKVIDQNLYLLPYDKGYALLTQQDRLRIRNEEIRGVLETYYGSRDQRVQSVFFQYRTAKSDQKIISILDGLQLFMQRNPDRRPEMLSKGEWEDLLRREMLIGMDSLAATLEDMAEVCSRPRGPKKYLAAIESDQVLVADVHRMVKDRRYADLADLQPLAFKRLQAIRKSDKADLDPDLVELVKENRSTVKNHLKKWMTESLIPLADWRSSSLMEEQAGVLFEMAAAFDQALQARKVRDGVMDFDDLETYALRLLDTPHVARRYQKRYAQIFVDEYQDTSYMQEAVLSRIRGENALFFVGDGKQSIYQFRGAAPQLFLSKAEGKAESFTCIRLNHNFRSSQTVIDGVNVFFNRRMTQDFGGVDYKKTDQLKSGAYHAAAVKPAFVVLSGREGVKDEVQWVAEEIRSLLEQGHLPQSIAVLARSLQPIQQPVRDAFQEAGIPLQTSQQSTSKDALAIGMYQALLFWMNGGVSDEAILAVMRFPQWGFSPEELSLIRIAYPEQRFAEACRSYGNERKDALGAKLQEFLAEMDGMRERSHRIPLADFLEELLSWRDFADSILAMPDGMQRSYGLRAYVEGLKNRIARGPVTLHQICSLIREENREGIGTLLPTIQGDQGVRLMTIHGSKGLEFETVFLINAAQGANLFDLKQSVLTHDDFGMAMTVYDPAVGATDIPMERRIAETILRRQQVSEEARIFYVAMTRAVQRLYVVAHDRDPAKTRGNRPYLKTVAGGLDFPSLYHWMVGAGIDQSEAWQYREISWGESQAEIAVAALRQAWTLRDAEGVFEEEQAYGMGSAKRRKVNITEWIRDGEKRKLTFEEKAQAIERGNAFHEVLEKVPLKRFDSRSHAETVLEDLKMSRRITEKTASLVDAERLLAWSKSSLGQRILSADQVLREKAFVGKLPAHAKAQYAQGKIDCLFREGDEWVLADYKLNMPKDLDQATAQVRAYCTILWECFGVSVKEACLYVWQSGLVLDVDLD